jgi:hypothetical protein
MDETEETIRSMESQQELVRTETAYGDRILEVEQFIDALRQEYFAKKERLWPRRSCHRLQNSRRVISSHSYNSINQQVYEPLMT